MASVLSITSVPPLFAKCSDTGDVNAIDICDAVVRIIGASRLDGVQKIGNLWRIYVEDKEARVQTYMKKTLMINNKEIRLFDQNPYVINKDAVQGKKDKLTIKSVPLSVSNDEIKQMLIDNQVTLSSPIRYGQLRTAQGHLTKFRSGDRYVYVEPFDPPLSRNQRVANIPCTVVHHGKEMTCRACGQKGHKVGDNLCKAQPTEEHVVFSSYTHPLSTRFACQLNVYETTFRSIDHAYFHRMALEFGQPHLAERIKDAKHAGEVKGLSKEITTPEKQVEWEKENIDVMVHLLQEKASQCKEFQNCLLEHRGKIFADASSNTLWGTGMSAYLSGQTAPNYWPGKNLLGAMLTELSSSLQNDRNNANHEIHENHAENKVDKETNQTETDTPQQQQQHQWQSENQNKNKQIQEDQEQAQKTTAENSQIYREAEPETETEQKSRPSRSRKVINLTPKQRRHRSNSSSRRKSSTPETPFKTMDIRKAFQREFDRKRKGLASSPGEEDEEIANPIKRPAEQVKSGGDKSGEST